MTMVETAVSATPRAIADERPAWLSRSLFPFESRFLSAGGVRFHYVDEGPRGAEGGTSSPPARGAESLLFLHGGPMSSFMWRHQLRTLRASYRCVAVDLPGLGLSKAPLAPGNGFAAMADALQAFVRAMKLDEFRLIAHATGGPSGLELAIRERARVRGIVLSNTFAWPLAGDPGLGKMVRIVSSRFFRFLITRFNLLPRIAARSGRRTGELAPDEKAAVLGPYDDPAARAHLANLLYGLRVESPFFASLRDRLPELASVPSLLIFGAEDKGYLAGSMDRFAKVLGTSSTVVLPCSAHFLTEDEPEAYTAALERWLSRRGGAAMS